MPLKVISPYTQKTVCALPFDRGEVLERKIERAREAFGRWRLVPLEERTRQVRKGLEYFRKNAERISRDVTLQMGKPIRQARREVETFFERAEYMLSIAQASLAPDVPPAGEGFYLRIEHVPLGVVLNIGAWNYPLLIPVNVVVPALLAGNTVLLKHSPRTPLCGAHFEEAFGRLDPPNLVTSLVLSDEQASRLIQDPRIGHLSFTGSVGTGRKVYQRAAARLLGAGLELGGKDCAYVAEDANLQFAVENIVDGACYNAGQSCCAVERVYVHRRHYEGFLERARSILGDYRMGDPLQEETTLGPLAMRSRLAVLEREVKDALRRGAKLLLGGGRVKGTHANFFPPTLLADVPNDALAMQEESFGPLLPIAPVDDDAQALARMADTRYGLSASIWSADRERAERFARDLEVGTVYQNRCDYLDPRLPWTGARESGIGSTLSRYGFLDLTRRKSIHFRKK